MSTTVHQTKYNDEKGLQNKCIALMAMHLHRSFHMMMMRMFEKQQQLGSSTCVGSSLFLSKIVCVCDAKNYDSTHQLRASIRYTVCVEYVISKEHRHLVGQRRKSFFLLHEE